MPSLSWDRQAFEALLDNNTFFIGSKKYSQSRLEAWGKRRTAVGTPEREFNANQLWMLKPSPDFPGYFYIESVEHKQFRLSMWDSPNGTVVLFNGNLFDDQLWCFRRDRQGAYTITNKLYPNSRLTKWGPDLNQWGTCETPLGDEQTWILTPRYSAKLSERTLWTVDNRSNQQFQFRQLEYTVGVTVDNSPLFRKRRGFKEAIELALQTECQGTFLAQNDLQRLNMELSNTQSSDQTNTWAQNQSLLVAIPPAKLYSVRQLVCSFESPISTDCCKLFGNYETIERD